MLNLRQHQIISIILLLFGAIFATIGLMNPFYSTAVIQYVPLILFGCLLLVAIIPYQLQSIGGAILSVNYYLKIKAGRRILDDIPPIDNSPYADSEVLYTIQAQLIELGLHNFGAFITDYSRGNKLNAMIWVYADETQTLFAELCTYANARYGVDIRTEYPDGFIVGTVFNIPLDVDSKRFHIRSFEDLQEAFDYHQFQVSLQTSKHGEPLHFTNIQTYIGGAEKEIAEKKAIAWDGGIAHLRAARWMILVMVLNFVVPLFLIRLFLAVGVASLIVGIAFWIEDFFIPRKPVSQTMEQRKKQKALQQ